MWGGRSAPGAFAQNTVDLIKTFAAQSAVAIENARLFQNVEASLQDLRELLKTALSKPRSWRRLVN
jgi:GAF domain-containing protein